MKKLFLTFYVVTFVLASCGKNYDTAKFEVINKSNVKLDSLIITNSQNDKIKNHSYYYLKVNETRNIDVNMTNSGGDGSYTISYKVDGIWYTKHFGYYTNGGQFEELISIHIFSPDSLFIDSQFNESY